MQDGYKVNMAPNGSCLMVTWTLLKKPPLGGRPNTKLGDHGIPKSPNQWFIIFHHVRGPCMNRICWGPRAHMTSHYTCGPVSTLHDFRSVLGRTWNTSFGLSQFQVHGSWLVCKPTLSTTTNSSSKRRRVIKTHCKLSSIIAQFRGQISYFVHGVILIFF